MAFGIVLYYLAVTSIAGFLLALRPQIIAQLLENTALTSVGVLIGVTVVFYVTSTVFESIVVANGEPQLGAIVIIVSNLCRSFTLLIAAVVWGNVQAIAWGALLYSFVQCGLMAVYMTSRFPGRSTLFDLRTIREQLSYTIPLGAAGLLWSLQLDVHNYFISHQFGAAAFAIYSQGVFQLPLIGILADSVLSVLIPRVSALQQADARADIIALTAKVMRTLAFAYFPMFIFLSVMAKDVIILLFTVKFLPSVMIFRVNLLMLPLSIVMVDPVMRAYKEQRFWMLYLNGVMLFVLVIVLKFRIASLGLVGTISCVVGVQYASRLLLAFHVARFLDVTRKELPMLIDVVKIAAASAVGGLIVFITRSLVGNAQKPFFGILFSLIPFVAAYISVLMVLKVPTREERQSIMTSVRRLFPANAC